MEVNPPETHKQSRTNVYMYILSNLWGNDASDPRLAHQRISTDAVQNYKYIKVLEIQFSCQNTDKG